jgi:hypothetical protein
MQLQLQQLQLQLQLHQQQTQQQQSVWSQLMQGVAQGPQLLSAVPMLLSNTQQQQALQPHMPTVNASAAAAVSAAFGSSQQQAPSLLCNAAPLGDPTSPFKGQGRNGGIMSLQHGTQTAAAAAVPFAAGSIGIGGSGFNHRYGAATNPLQQSLEQQQQQLLQSLIQSAAQGRRSAVVQPALISQQQQQQQGNAVLRRVDTNEETWSSCDTTIYLRVEGLGLSDDALSDAAVRGHHVLLAHMLLEDFTRPEQQCTETALADG